MIIRDNIRSVTGYFLNHQYLEGELVLFLKGISRKKYYFLFRENNNKLLSFIS